MGHAGQAQTLDRLIVATDDPRIARVASGAGVESVMTPADLPSGSDRVATVMRSLAGAGDRYDVVVNVQGDEPFLPGEAIDRAVEHLLKDPEVAIATLAVPAGPDDLDRPDVVKVVMGPPGRALYFSRAAIPYPRNPEGVAGWRHVGLYAFRAAYLERFVGLPVSPLERRESLEQLRALEDGAAIGVAVGDWPALGIDTPGDLARAQDTLRRLKSKEEA